MLLWKVSLRSGGTGRVGSTTPSHPFLPVFPEEQPQPTEGALRSGGYEEGISCAVLPRHFQGWGLGSCHICFACPEAGVCLAWGVSQVGWTQHLAVLSAYRATSGVPSTGGTAAARQSQTASAAPWAPYFSRTESHLLFQLTSGAQFFRSAKWLGLDWFYGCYSSHGRLNQPSATKWGRGGRWGRKVM